MYNYKRTLGELEANACKWWPQNLVELEAESSIIPVLIRTQNQFISILTLTQQENPLAIFDIINASRFSANLFLKHLMVLTDFGAEPLQRVNRDFRDTFPGNKLVFSIGGQTIEYSFTSLPAMGVLNNTKMHMDTKRIYTYEPTNDFFKDIIVLLLFGGNSTDDRQAEIFAKCVVGNLMGKDDELTEFIKQRYIFVSRITGGAQANSLGNAAQTYVNSYLHSQLGNEYKMTSNGHVPGVTQNNGRTLTTFDLVVEKGGKYVAIEISFQVTTNSTIERKGGQARARLNAIEASENYIAYIIDGAGNFQRESALKTICANSHCTVAYTDDELSILASFIKEKLG